MPLKIDVKILKLINHETVSAALKGGTFHNTLYSLLSFFFKDPSKGLTFTGEQHITLSIHIEDFKYHPVNTVLITAQPAIVLHVLSLGNGFKGQKPSNQPNSLHFIQPSLYCH